MSRWTAVPHVEQSRLALLKRYRLWIDVADRRQFNIREDR